MFRRRRRIAFALRDHDALFDERERGLAARLSFAYVGMALVGGGLSVWLVPGAPLQGPAPWIDLPSVARAGISAGLGVALALVLVLATRFAVVRARWARRLVADLSPIARRLSDRGIAAVAILSSLGEELLFRSLLVPLLGVLAASALFGVVHQVRGPSRFVWMAWATGAGLLLSTLFAATGSIVGPFLCHALVNAANLTLLRDLPLDDQDEIARGD